MAKQIIYSDEARDKLKIGVDKLANAVKITLGPKGKNVAIDKGYGSPLIINDGVSIAKEIELKDKFENLGAELVKEVANKTNDLAGDGTTTATVLTQAIVSEGIKNVAAGSNPMAIRRGIQKGVDAVCKHLKEMSKEVSTKEEIAQVASISADDNEIGKIIAEAIEIVGKDGVITVEESQSFEMSKEIVEGMQFDKGYLSPYMVTNAEKMTAQMENVPILITDKKISAIKDILKLLEDLASQGKKDLVIICEDLDGEALTTLVINKLRGVFNVLAIKAPGYGDNKKEMLEDIAILTGTEVISEEKGQKLEDVNLEDLGSAGRVISEKDSTTIVNGNGRKENIEERISLLKKSLENNESKYDKEKIEERIAKLSGGVAVIKVGASSETEMKEKKLRVEDAINSTKAATREGIVAGGGVALLKCEKTLENLKIEDPEERIGVDILKRALVSPIKQIAENAGKEGSVIAEQVRKNDSDYYGYNAATDVFEDLFKSGIVDPTEVTRTALQNAASISAMFLTTEVAIAELPEEHNHDDMSMNPGMGGMMGM